MVNETRHITVLGRINDFTILSTHHIGASRYLVFFNAFLADDAIFMEYLTDVLHQKAALGYVLASR